MPNRNILIAGIAILIIVIAGSAYLKLGKFKNTQIKTTNIKTSPTPVKNKSLVTSLLSLLASGGNNKCSFEITQTAGGKTKGTVYISGNKMYNTFTITDKTGKTSKMSMLKLADENYIWGDTLPQGIKMKLSVDDLKSNTDAGQYVDLNQKADYKCDTWIPDQSVFNIPANIKFMDVSALMAKPTSASTGTSSPCNSITDPQTKAACENALNK